jgi:hypothetical protein
MRLVRELQEGGQRSEAEAAEAELAQLSPRVARASAEVLAAAGDAEKYPALAPYTRLHAWREPLLDDFRRIRREARELEGVELDRATVLDRLNAELARLSPAGANPASPAGAMPARPVAESATSIAPSMSRAGGVREMTQAEREADLARDTAQLESWFGPRD